MEIESNHDEAASTMFSGSVSISANSTIGSVHELEAGPRSNGDRCLVTTVDKHTGICLPSILTDWEVPNQGVCQEKVSRLILITPMKSTQPWYPVLQSMAITEPMVMQASPDLLQNHRGEIHPLIA